MSSSSDPQQHFGEKRVGKAVREAIERGVSSSAPARDPKDLPNLTDMSPESITDNVIAINSETANPRLKFVMEALVRHLHNFTREVSLTDKEWMMALEFLTKTGQTCTDLRQEFILLSDIFGWSALVDSLNHPTPKDSTATEATVLGPFFVEDSKDIPVGGAIASEGKGEYMYVSGRVLDLEGNGVPNCKIETWETDFEGLYDTQYADRSEPDCRGRITTDANGNYAFRGVRPVAYPIPNDGPVGKLLREMGRHVFRPAHLHMMLEAPGFEKLITALYPEGDEYIKSDAVFGVKSSLICKLEAIYDNEKAKSLGFKSGPYWDLKWDFVLLTEEQAEAEKRKSLPNFYRFETQ